MDSNQKAQFYFGKWQSKNASFESSRSIPGSIKILLAKFNDKKYCFKVLGKDLIFFFFCYIVYEIGYYVSIVYTHLKFRHLGIFKRTV